MPDQPTEPDNVTTEPITIRPHRRQVPRDEQPQADEPQAAQPKRYCDSARDSFADEPGLSPTERNRREGLRGTPSDVWTTY